MPSSTPRYLIPYALGSDPAYTVADTMRALADHLDLCLGESDTTQITAAGAGTVTKRINYTRTYPDPLPIPRATAQLNTNHADTVLGVDAEDRTGFTLTLRTSTAGTATRTVRWFARVVS